jgi:hypothetical protein
VLWSPPKMKPPPAHHFRDRKPAARSPPRPKLIFPSNANAYEFQHM